MMRIQSYSFLVVLLAASSNIDHRNDYSLQKKKMERNERASTMKNKKNSVQTSIYFSGESVLIPFKQSVLESMGETQGYFLSPLVVVIIPRLFSGQK